MNRRRENDMRRGFPLFGSRKSRMRRTSLGTRTTKRISQGHGPFLRAQTSRTMKRTLLMGLAPEFKTSSSLARYVLTYHLLILYCIADTLLPADRP